MPPLRSLIAHVAPLLARLASAAGRRPRAWAGGGVGVLALVVGLVVAAPGTYTVNDTGDAPDAALGDGICATAGGVCTLRAALEEANSTSGAKALQFNLASCTAAANAPTAGLLGEYYNNTSLAGTPVLTRVEAVSFDWVSGSPGTGVNSDLFSVRWSGTLTIPTTGTYTFQTNTDDGVRLTVDGRRLLDSWYATNGVLTTTTMAFTAGQTVPVVMEFAEYVGNAYAELRWQTPGSGSFVAIPIAQHSSPGTGTACRIRPATALPVATAVVDIDATTQPGYTNAPLVELSGELLGSAANGLTLQAAGSRVRGLAINRFGWGLRLAAGNGHNVQGNWIGLDRYGMDRVPNAYGGIDVASGTSGHTIGGTGTNAGNVISGNAGPGLQLAGDTSTVQGNLFGRRAGDAGQAPQPQGIRISGGASNTIGGVLAGQANVFGLHYSAAVAVVGGSATGNRIRGNRINGPVGPGIDLGDDGITANDNLAPVGLPNLGVDFPTLTASTLNGGTLAVSGYVGAGSGAALFAGATVDVYQADRATATSGVTNHGAGLTWLGAFTVAGDGSFSGTLSVSGLAPGAVLTSTTTDAAGNTSEFGPNRVLVAAGLAVNDPGDAADATPGDGLCATAGGVCTLRAAIQEANAAAVAQTVRFNLPTCTAVGGLDNTSFTGNYYNNTTFTGSPVLTRREAVDFDWDRGSPAPGVLADYFTARWQGNLVAPVTGDYVFQVHADDGKRLTVNGTLLVERWTNGNTTETSAAVALTAGQSVPVTVELMELAGAAIARLLWKVPGSSVFVPVPLAPAAGAACPIQPTSGLPAITAPISIDATTQPGYAGTPRVELRGHLAGGSSGLTLSAAGVTVRGLAVTGFIQGITINGNNAVLQGNYLGLDTNGTPLRNYSHGIGANGSQLSIGTAGAGNGNVISANSGAGIWVTGQGSSVLNNYIGLSPDGTVPMGNTAFFGIEVYGGGGNRIGAAGAGNVISAQTGSGRGGVWLYSPNNIVEGNRIGTDKDGTAALGNAGPGVAVVRANNRIGGDTAGAGNVISGNGDRGIVITSVNTTVYNNRIGTNALGTAALPNASQGVYADGNSTGLVVGGAGALQGNLVSGNTFEGISSDAPGSVIQGNRVGYTADGSAALINQSSGIRANGINATIGGATAAAGNHVTTRNDQNNAAGSAIYSQAAGAVVRNNKVGVDTTGAAALSPPAWGLIITGGGAQVRDNQVVAVNLGGSSTGGSNSFTGNKFGTDSTGANVLQNATRGVFESITSTGDRIGGSGVGEANVFAGSTTYGLGLAGAGQNVLVSRNTIFSVATAIDHDGNGPTANDGVYTINTPNLRIDKPVFTQSAVSGGTLTVAGYVGSAPGQTVFGGTSVEVYVSDGLANGSGNARRYLGTLTANASAAFSGSFDVSTLGFTGSTRIAAIAIDSNNNTSEFSNHAGVGLAQAYGVAGIRMWVDASDVDGDGTAAGEPAVNASVQQLTDKAGNGLHFTSQAGNQPTSISSGSFSRRVLRFTTSQWMRQVQNFPAPTTVIYVARTTGGSNARMLQGVANNWLLGWWQGGEERAFYEGWVYGWPSGGITPTQQARIMSGVMRGPGAPSDFAVNGQPRASNTAGVTGPNGLAINTGGFPAEPTDAEVAEILVFDRALSATERNAVESALATKWGVSGVNSSVLLTGTVFEDRNYGGGAGRPRATALAGGGAVVPNATVELYSAAGALLGSAITDSSGLYTFPVSASTSYTVRVVNRTVRSNRNTAASTALPVQTFRTDGSSGTAVAVADRVGGEAPSLPDSAANNGSQTLAALAAGNTAPQSVAAVTVGATSVSNVDFGFNFSTVVNTNDTGQGSLRQFITNSLALGGQASLAQVGQRLGVAGGAEALPAGRESSIFMVPSGSPVPGLRAGVASGLTSGVARITLGSSLPTLSGTLTSIDGSTQAVNVSGTGAALGTAGTVGADAVALSSVPAPRVALVAPTFNPLTISGSDNTLRGVAVGAAAQAVVVVSATRPTLELNVLGTEPTSFADPGASNRVATALYVGNSAQPLVQRNLLGFASGTGVVWSNTTGGSFTGNEVRGTGASVAASAGLSMVAATSTAINNNLFSDQGGYGIDIEATSSSVVLTNNTVTRSGLLGAQTAGVRLAGSNHLVDRHRITANYGVGVLVRAGAGHSITRTLAWANGAVAGNGVAAGPRAMGIDVGGNGVLANDGVLNPGTANNGMDMPVLTLAQAVGSTLNVAGFVGTGSGNAAFAGATVEVFISDSDPSGYGGGQQFLGSFTANAAGQFSGSVAINPAQVTAASVFTATATLAGAGTSDFSANLSRVTVSGTVFEDVNYGGGPGRSLAGSGGAVLQGATVEVYSNTGALLATTTTDNTGRYAFQAAPNNSYQVRVVGSSVPSSRPGWNAGLRGVLTFRTDASTGTPQPVADRVGGENPLLADAAANTGAQALSALTTGSTVPQSLAPVTVGTANRDGLDFGFNFNTVVNTANSGAGSLRQVLANAETLGGDAALQQQFRTAAIEHVVFMISNGTTGIGGSLNLAAGGLRSAFNAFTTPAGATTVATIADNGGFGIGSAMVVNAQTQPGWAGSPRIQLNGAGGGAAISQMFGIQADNVTVRGFIINGARDGFRLMSSTNLTIAGNWIGLNAAGTAAGPNTRAGILLVNAATFNNVLIGGTTPADRNVIAGNAASGIVSGTNFGSGNAIRGNWVGLDANGTTAVPNAAGVEIGGSPWVIGGSTPAERNVISGNGGWGVVLRSSGNTLAANFIGTTADGTAQVANGWTSSTVTGGVLVSGADNTVGGSTAAAGNVITGYNTAGANYTYGVQVTGARALLRFNRVGLNAAGTAALPAPVWGVHLVGNDAVVRDNTLVGSSSLQLWIDGWRNTIAGNRFNTDITGTTALGSGRSIGFTNGASDNTVGGTGPGDANVFTSTGAVTGDAIGMQNLSGIQRNRISRNVMRGVTQGIDLGDNGLGTNTGSTSASLPNNGMNAPVLQSATWNGDQVQVLGYVGSAAGQTAFANAQVEVFLADAATGPQGRTYLGTVTTDNNGVFNGRVTAPAGVTLATGNTITATATDSSGNTSEFGAKLTISAAAAFQNGGFETSPDPGGVALALYHGSNSITGWTVLHHSIDVQNYFQAGPSGAGTRTVDLAGFAAGGLQQSFVTAPGTTYTVSFDLAGNMGAAPTVKNARATAVGASMNATASYSFDTTGKSIGSMGWATRQFVFTADSTLTTLKFESLDGATAGGAVIDNVSFTTSVGIGGTVFEDVNYGGGPGRSRAASGGVGRPGVTVELYTAAGAFVASTTTDSNGSYAFNAAASTAYKLRVLTSSLSSSRSGWTSALLPVQTYRAAATAGVLTAVTDEVGGANPAATAAEPAAGTLAGARHVSDVGTATAGVANLDFGFNYNTVVNTNDSGAGSLRQAIANVNTLTGETSLAQQYRTAGVENIIFMVSNGTPGGGGSLNLPVGGLRSSLNYFTTPAGSINVATIAVSSALPQVTAGLVLDAQTQPGWNGAVDTPVPVLELNGAATGANSDGLVLNAAGVTVRGFTINRFSGQGIYSSSGSNLTIQGVWAGIDASGTARAQNGGSGIYLSTAGSGFTIGGNSATTRNVLSGSAWDGLAIDKGTGHVVQGNYVGLNAAGSAAVGNVRHGVSVFGTATGASIGGNVATARNVISGNATWGVALFTANNVIKGNYIGTDFTGTVAVGNKDGVYSSGANTTIGGATAAEGNVVTGTTAAWGTYLGVGIGLHAGATGSTVRNNLVGLNAAGTAALDPPRYGLQAWSGSSSVLDNTIGGTGLAVWLGSANNTLQGNRIGVGLNGSTPVGNTAEGGIGITGAGSDNLIGGSGIGQANTIANGGYGIILRSSTSSFVPLRNRISRNVIVGNSVGIDLSKGYDVPGPVTSWGATANDGATNALETNNGMDTPVLASAVWAGDQLQVVGHVAVQRGKRLLPMPRWKCSRAANTAAALVKAKCGWAR